MADNNNDWKESLPDSIRANESLGKFKDVGALANSYIELQRMMGSRDKLPNAESKDEEWSTHYEKLGRPKDTSGYKFPDIPKEYAVSDDFKGALTGLAHQMGLNQRQFDNMVSWGMSQSKAIGDRQAEVTAGLMKGLKDKWGFAADANMERAHKTIAMLAGYKADHPFVKWLEESGNDRNPVIMDFFYDVSKQFEEDNFVDEHTKREAADRSMAQSKINGIMADHKHPYWNEGDPRHGDAVKEVADLYEQLNE
jgi:hypothetical protein